MVDVRFVSGIVANCVKCGVTLDKRTAHTCAVNKLPPGCDDCFDEIMEEVEKNHSMWPHDWYGHAYKKDGRWIIQQEVGREE